MTRPAATCPSCGAPVEFLWSGAVQTTCAYCRSVLVRRDLDLEAVGRKSQVPITASPIRVGARGAFEGRPFQVVGRIVYEYERGRWSEWHLVFSDGASGWLSDALAEYAVSFLSPEPGALPRVEAIQPGRRFRLGGVYYQVASLTPARYAGTEGELPFEYWDKEEVPFADLKADEGGGFATIDYSESPPLLFAGKYVDFADLRLTGLATEEEEAGGPRAEAETFSCPSCGGTVEVRAAGLSVNVVCRHCSSVLDARSPAHQVLQNFKWNIIREPKIPLGARGRLHGAEWDVLGFQVRSIRVEGVEYSWDEYLLYNRERGFRYLTEYQGHWNDAVTLRSTPRVTRGARPAAHLHGKAFKHFQTARAETTFVLGEFPWEVRVGDTALTQDYVAPPRMLSLEETEGERTWTLAEYVPGTRIWQAFGVPGKPPLPKGVFANQPSPHGPAARQLWAAFALLFALFLAFLIYRMGSMSDEPVARGFFAYDPATPEEERGAVLGPFQVGGRTSNLEVGVRTDVANSWAYFDFALVNEATGKTTLFGREVSYYQGVDQGERWSEGDAAEAARVPSVPPGRYLLHVYPDGPAPVRYTVEVRRDVPATSFYVFAFLLLLVPPVFSLLAAGSFESKRWAESDYAGGDE